MVSQSFFIYGRLFSGGECCFEILDGALEPFAPPYQGFEIDLLFDLADVGKGLKDVAFADRQKLGFDVFADDFVERIDEVQNGMVFAVGNVEYFVLDAWRGRRQDVGGDDVVDIGKVARLFAVAENGRLLVVEDAVNKFRDDDGVFVVKGLSGAEDVEVPQADGLDAEVFGKDAAIVFAGELA